MGQEKQEVEARDPGWEPVAVEQVDDPDGERSRNRFGAERYD